TAVDGLLGATPELLVRRARGLVTSRVLAGTIQRTGDDEAYLARAASLARSASSSPVRRSGSGACGLAGPVLEGSAGARVRRGLLDGFAGTVRGEHQCARRPLRAPSAERDAPGQRRDGGAAAGPCRDVLTAGGRPAASHRCGVRDTGRARGRGHRRP